MVSCSEVSQQHVSQNQETHGGRAHIFAGSADVGQLLALHRIDLASDGRLRHEAKTTCDLLTAQRTSRSLSRLFSPTIIPSYTLAPGARNSTPRSCSDSSAYDTLTHTNKTNKPKPRALALGSSRQPASTVPPRARRARYQTPVPAALYRPLELLVALEQPCEHSST